MAADDEGTPTFADVVKAVTPQGTDFEAFKQAMRGEGAAGNISPQLITMLNASGGLQPRVLAQSGTTCARCEHQHGGPPGPLCLEAERKYGRAYLRRSPDLQLDEIASPRRELALPADPMPRTASVAAVAAHELFLDFVAGGFSDDQALTIIARMIAAGPGGDDEQP